MNPEVLAPGLEIPRPLAGEVTWLPVRHHSPACARVVRRLLREIRPDVVLLEGPRDATPLLPLLVHADTRPPVALYAAVPTPSGLRRAAYYPFCDYSPELVALQTAHELGIPARFIDLRFDEQLDPEESGAANLLDERPLHHSRVLRRACERSGARDPDDLWDHLYESDPDPDPEEFLRGVLAYCALARQGCPADERDLAREAAMAWEIAHERKAGRRVAVLTGGFHTVALPGTTPRRPSARRAPAGTLMCLMRYGFPQLDRLNGYGSGMPSPEFYQGAWEGRDPALVLVSLGRSLRDGGISVADEQEAVLQVRGLAALRGHRTPTREDVLDATRSCYVKGSLEVEGAAVLARARALFSGDRRGQVPAEAGQPPLVEDFRQVALGLGLDPDSLERREVALDLYRSARHRQRSRFLHQLRRLDVPFGRVVRGPDFVQGRETERVQEVWDLGWTPACEAGLLEASEWGASVEEASAARLHDESRKAAGDAGEACRLLLEACVAGHHARLPDLRDAAAEAVAADARFASQSRALHLLSLLHCGREPLEAHDLPGVRDLAEACYRRACYLLAGLASTDEREEEAVLGALLAVPEAIRLFGEEPWHREARRSGLLALRRGNPALAGAATGLLYGEGALSAEEVVRDAAGWTLTHGAGFLRGLLAASRSVLWSLPDLVPRLTATFAAWSGEEFRRHLPGLRLAFTGLTPGETDRVAGLAARAAGAEDLGLVRRLPVAEADLPRALDLEEALRASLERDDLGDWLA